MSVFGQRTVRSAATRTVLFMCCALTVAGVAVLAPASPASAGGCGTLNDRAGYQQGSAQAVIGSMISLTVRSGVLCFEQNQLTANYAFTRVGEVPVTATGHTAGYALAGHFRSYGQSTRAYGEYRRPGDAFPVIGFAPGSLTIGNQYSFWVYYDSSNGGHLDMNVGFTGILYTPWNPYYEWDSAGAGWLTGAIDGYTSNIPGTSAAHENHGAMQVQPFGSGSYSFVNTATVSACCAVSPSDFEVSAIFYNSFDTWNS